MATYSSPHPNPLPAYRERGKTGPALLVLSQVFVPDPASVGQHIADVALELGRRGHRVVVYTTRRGYEDPQKRYPPRQQIGPVLIRRMPLASFGKKSMLLRMIGSASFMIQALIICLLTPSVEGIFFSTSPPLVGLIGCIAGWIRRVPVIYWAMDLNPDQLIALGKIKAASLPARILESFNRFILRRSSLIVALDRFMADRLHRRGNIRHKLLVLPPWPHETHLAGADGAKNAFRLRNGLEGKFVFMYSGNHSPSNPLDTILQAALKFRDDPTLRFVFVGGGLGKKEIEEFISQNALTNVLSLPYVAIDELGTSLSAADVHIVSLGQPMVGIVHPCKIYGAMAVARPILYLGPEPSHIADLIAGNDIGWRLAHGEVAAAVARIAEIRQMDGPRLAEMGRRAQALLQASFSQQSLCSRFCDAVEEALRL